MSLAIHFCESKILTKMNGARALFAFVLLYLYSCSVADMCARHHLSILVLTYSFKAVPILTDWPWPAWQAHVLKCRNL